MSLPKKGARSITVDGVVYRWRVRGKPTYAQALAWTPLTVAVELAALPGATLVVTFAHAHPGNWLGHPVVPIQPGVVAASIRIALAQGWRPADPGRAFLLDRTRD